MPLSRPMSNFDALFYQNPQPMWVYAVDSLLILEVNNAAIQRYGYTRDEFTGKSIEELRPCEDIPVLSGILKSMRNDVSVHKEVRHVTKDGAILTVEITSYAMQYEGADARMVQAQNIDARKAMQGKLQLTQSKLDRLLDSTSIGFYQLDNSLNITYWNNASEKLIGYNSSYVIGKNIWDVFPEAIHSDFQTYLEKAINERINVEFTEYFWPIQKWFFTNVYPGEDGILVHFRDVTHIKRAQEILLEKIDQLKEISFLNSHYIRKPVASLLGLTNLLHENIANPEEFKDIAQKIQVCSLELDKVIKKINKKVNDGDNLKDLAFEMEEFSFTDLVNEIIDDYKKNTFGHFPVLRAATDVCYYGNKHGIKIAIESLIDNAIKFSPDGGRILITLDMVNQNLVLSVQDYGIGMNARLINKVFLGFAKKEHSRKLGEGLAKVAEVTRRHHGNIWVESKPGKGSVFSIRFPLSNISAFRAGNKTDCTPYRDPGLDIAYVAEGKYLRLDWKGFHSLHTIRAGCLKLADVLLNYDCHLVLNDNTNVMGSWEDAAEWVGKECFPMLEKAGLRYLAWVYSPSTFSRLSADLVIEISKGDVVIQTFDDEQHAKKWLVEAGNVLESIP
jgi:PAS domain S-box-containing protein